MNRLEEFRAAIYAAGEQSEIPSLRAILERRQPAPVLQFRWAAAAMAVVALGAIPIVRDAREQQRATERDLADAVLMEKVNAALSRPVPRALSPLMGERN